MSYKIIDGKHFSKIIKNEIKIEIQNLSNSFTPTIAVILIGDNEASKVYLKSKQNACDYVGIKILVYNLSEETKEKELINLIKSLNNSKYINGILIELPLPKHINKNKIFESISIEKDIDCFNPYNFGKLSNDPNILKPCTAAAVMEVLKRSHIKIESKNCVILGRNNIIGKPLAMLMLNENATVTICHSYTKDLINITKYADILISSVGKINFIKPDMIKENSVIIDIGINIKNNGKICGDIEFETVKEKVAYITPVPGGIGPMTVTMLLKNCLQAYKNQNKI